MEALQFSQKIGSPVIKDTLLPKLPKLSAKTFVVSLGFLTSFSVGIFSSTTSAFLAGAFFLESSVDEEPKSFPKKEGFLDEVVSFLVLGKPLILTFFL